MERMRALSAQRPLVKRSLQGSLADGLGHSSAPCAGRGCHMASGGPGRRFTHSAEASDGLGSSALATATRAATKASHALGRSQQAPEGRSRRGRSWKPRGHYKSCRAKAADTCGRKVACRARTDLSPRCRPRRERLQSEQRPQQPATKKHTQRQRSRACRTLVARKVPVATGGNGPGLLQLNLPRYKECRTLHPSIRIKDGLRPPTSM